jgi:hypothetical protein
MKRMRLAAWIHIYIVTWLQIKASFHRYEADNEYLLTWLISAIKSRKLQSSWWQNECQQTRVSKIQLLFTVIYYERKIASAATGIARFLRQTTNNPSFDVDRENTPQA